MNHRAILAICAGALLTCGLAILPTTSDDSGAITTPNPSTRRQRAEEAQASAALRSQRLRPVLGPASEMLFDPTPDDWTSIASPEAVTILQVIDDGNHVHDAALEHLSRFRNTTALVLFAPSVTNEGLRHILAMSKLEALIVYNAQITDDGLQQLRDLKSLKVIGLCATANTSQGVVALNRQLRHAYVELWNYGGPQVVFDHNGCVTPAFAKKYLRP